MTNYLVFTLVAPMGSFADAPGDHRRGSAFSWPGRSAVLGLLGAAAGIRRDDADRLKELSRFHTAVAVFGRGGFLKDFHTVQTIPHARIENPGWTRREAVGSLTSGDNPKITYREYYMDCAYGAAVWGMKDLSSWAESLQYPIFVPYLGRKSCPLSAPMAPQIVSAENLKQAIFAIKMPHFIEVDPSRPILVASDVQPDNDHRVEVRWDNPLDRSSWHFGQRQVYISNFESTIT